MAQQSSELKVSLDSSAADRAISKLTKDVQKLQKEASSALSVASGLRLDERRKSLAMTAVAREQKNRQDTENRAQKRRERDEDYAVAQRRKREEVIQREEDRARRVRIQEQTRRERRREDRIERASELRAKTDYQEEVKRRRRREIREEREEKRRREEPAREAARAQRMRDAQAQMSLNRGQALALSATRQGVVSGAGGNFAGLLGAGGGLLGGGFTALGGALRRLPYAPLASALGFDALGKAVPIAGEMAGAAVRLRMNRTQSAAGMEATRTRLRFAGYSPAFIDQIQDRFAKLGFSPQESLSIISDFEAQTGGVSTGRTGNITAGEMSRIGAFQRSGVRAQTFGAFGAGAVAGGGVRSNIGQRQMVQVGMGLANVFSRQGLRGQGLERALLQVANNTNQMAQGGLQVDAPSIARFVGGISQTAEEMGARQFMGGGAMGVVSTLQKGAGGALEQFRGMFSGIGESMLLAEAARGGGGPMAMARRLEKLKTKPELTRDVLRRRGRVGRLGLFGLGLSTTGVDVAMKAGRADLPATGGDPADIAIESEMQLSRELAEKELTATREIEQDKKASTSFITATSKLEEAALSLTEAGSAIETLVTKISGLIDSVF